jgi:UTP--glucose-1-phosphate uridylyltransferase
VVPPHRGWKALCYRAGALLRGKGLCVTLSVRTAVFPAAGLGTRFLPATKTMPKEMLPLVDKPIIQYAVEEAVAAGIDQIVMVTARGKTAMIDHFDIDVELETFLEERGKLDQLASVRHVSALARIGAVRQGPPLGLGHAVCITRDLVGDQPFAVVLADDVIDADPPAIRQLIDVFDRVQGPVLAVERVPLDQISRYGVVRAEPLGDGVHRITDLVEKPSRDQAPSDLAIMGRYVLTPDIFAVLAGVREDHTGEIQLTSGLRELLRQRPLYAYEVRGTRHDTGTMLGFLKASMYFAMQRGELREPLGAYLRTLLGEEPARHR